MKKEHQKKMESLMEDIDDATDKDEMSKTEAMDFLEELHGSIETRIDCLRDELAAEEEG